MSNCSCSKISAKESEGGKSERLKDKMNLKGGTFNSSNYHDSLE